MTTLGINAYLALLEKYPHLTNNSDGELEIITDRELLYREQERLYRTADEKGRPRTWYDLGIVAQDQWTLVLRDLVRFPNGTCGGYLRKINRNSQLELSGKDVSVLVTIDGKVLLMKHFRHDDRAWHWECPRGFGEAGLSPEENALKEISEETGLTVLELTRINPENEQMAFFCAKCSGSCTNTDGTEVITEFVLADLDEVAEMIVRGKIDDPYTIRSLVLASLHSCL
ncbi:MAG: NUDIX hydrolase [Ruminococcaceae bacterium]|nr:NUDIX hydrolase [Oscillospiraceae bacterium]